MKKKRNSDYVHDHIPALKEKARSISIAEGTAANVTTNLGDNYIIPFALALNAQPIHIGFLSSFSGFLYQISQFFGSRMMKKYPRKRIVLTFVLLQALMWLFIGIIALLVLKNTFNGYSFWLLILFYAILMFFGGIAYPPLFSWIGDILQDESRGSFLAKRNAIAGFAGMFAAILGALFLDYWKTKGLVLLAFAILFALASLSRFISYLLFTKQYAPQFKQKKRDYFSIISFIKRFDNFGKFAFYHGFLNLAIMIASPFFSVYMLKELGFSYTEFTIAIISYAIFNITFLPLAGRFSDRYGNKKLLIITNFFFALTPILYMLVKTPLGVILLPQLSAGIASAASVISFSNFTYDAVSPKHRSICVTYTNILIGIGTLIGSIIGGLIVNYFYPPAMNPYIFVFLVAAILRGSVALLFLPHIKEVRRVKRLPARYNFFFHPFHSLHRESIRLIHLPERALGKLAKPLKIFT